MLEPTNDPPEFTPDELQAACEQVGEDAQRKTFAVGAPITILRNRRLIQIYQDGREIDVGPVKDPAQETSHHS